MSGKWEAIDTPDGWWNTVIMRAYDEQVSDPYVAWRDFQALRKENARLKARLVEMYERIIPEEIAKGLERLTRERDEARERVEVCLRVNENVGKELLAADAEVARLEGLISGHEAWVDADPDQWVMRKDTRIRAQREEGR